ncbi:MAG: methionyl-tRNA formyltransferase [Selenomonadaceae bacterium]|nr:methionyl-tRNA formyltransferase [Selenomonadaceae bacterium]
MSIVIASSRLWHKRFTDEIERRTGEPITYIDDKTQLNFESLERLAPSWVFFPHWSYIIPSSVHENFRCVIFHMTDLPFGRGGSPLQNLIARGIYETQLSAIKCVKTLDGGDIYMKRPLSLWGSAREIFLRAAELVKEMMIEIIRAEPTPYPQQGEPVVFKRRTPPESNIDGLDDLKRVFDYIRMLDAEGYPPAFLETAHLRLEFSRASLSEEEILADVRIRLRANDE